MTLPEADREGMQVDGDGAGGEEEQGAAARLRLQVRGGGEEGT